VTHPEFSKEILEVWGVSFFRNSIINSQNALQYILMWFFKRKKSNQSTQEFNPACPACRSTDTRVVTSYDFEQPGYVKTWRGQRYITCRCLGCGKDFYVEEPPAGLSEEAAVGDELVADEDELHAAEEALKRDIEEKDDRRCP
jgi:hypothetical protein